MPKLALQPNHRRLLPAIAAVAIVTGTLTYVLVRHWGTWTFGAPVVPAILALLFSTVAFRILEWPIVSIAALTWPPPILSFVSSPLDTRAEPRTAPDVDRS